MQTMEKCLPSIVIRNNVNAVMLSSRSTHQTSMCSMTQSRPDDARDDLRAHVTKNNSSMAALILNCAMCFFANSFGSENSTHWNSIAFNHKWMQFGRESTAFHVHIFIGKGILRNGCMLCKNAMKLLKITDASQISNINSWCQSVNWIW